MRERQEIQEVPRRSGLSGGGIILGIVLGLIGCAPAETAARNPDTRLVVDTVDVALLEYAIGVPTRLPAGTITFKLSNQGFEIHNLKLYSSGASAPIWQTATDLNPGQTELVSVELAPGTYSFRCDLAGHDTRGMQIEVEVEARPR